MRAKPKESEAELQLAICDYLALKKYVFWRQNNLSVYDPTRKVFRSMPKYAMAGVSDIILLLDSRAWFIEVKIPTGKQSENQKKFKEMVEKTGNLYYIITSLDDLLKLGF